MLRQTCPKEVCEDTDLGWCFYHRALPCADILDPFRVREFLPSPEKGDIRQRRAKPCDTDAVKSSFTVYNNISTLQPFNITTTLTTSPPLTTSTTLINF
jgi:hypothetical protein